MTQRQVGTAQVFDLALVPLELEAGARIERHVARGWWWGPAEDLPALRARALVQDDEAYRARAWQVAARSTDELDSLRRRCEALAGAKDRPKLSSDIPTILVVHALTGDMRAGGPEGWWERVIGDGKALDPGRFRLLCFNLLGSCYGTSGPTDESFPRRVDDRRFPPAGPAPKGDLTLPEAELPATVTTWDHARAILSALDALGVGRVHLAVGGSLGAMIVMCLAALAPDRFERMVPIGAAEKTTSWIIGWNHVQRQAILLDPHFPADPRRGLELARQIGMLTYRAEPGTELKQGRRFAGSDENELLWSSRAHYRISTYLEHQGHKLVGRFDSRAYLALLGAMDHHDLSRVPPWMEREAPGDPRESWGEARIRAGAFCVGIDTDQLFFPATIRAFADRLRARGVAAEFGLLSTPHGHDGFLIETDKMNELLWRALRLRSPR